MEVEWLDLLKGMEGIDDEGRGGGENLEGKYMVVEKVVEEGCYEVRSGVRVWLGKVFWGVD